MFRSRIFARRRSSRHYRRKTRSLLPRRPMAANSELRRFVKRLLRPVTSDAVYSRFQMLAMSWDICRGNWTEPELKLIPHALKPGESALDIGANYGMYCYHLSRAAGPNGKVFGFEPIPFTFNVF